MSSPYYAPSGRLPARAVMLASVCALAVLVPAWLYAWLTIHSPFVLINWLAMAAFAVAMGVGAQMAARLGKARNPLWMGRLGLMIGISGWYAHWATWLAIADAGSFGSLLGDPRAMWGFASLVAEHEVRSIMGMRIEGSVLVAGWIIEFILLASLPRSLARMAAEAPFCELTDAWAEMFELPRKFAWIDEPHVAVHRLESAPGQLFSILDDCPEQDPMRYSAITLYRSATDPFISIDNVSIERSANKEKKSTRAVVTYLRLPNMDADGLIAHCLPAAAPGPASEAAPDMAAPADPPELVDAIDHLTAGRLEQALAGAAPHIAATRDDLRIDALRLCAFATARLSRWTEAQHYWHALFDEERSAFNASQTGCNLAMTGDLEQAGEWIARARELNAATGEMPDSQIVTSYISALTQAGHPAQAMPYLDQLRTLYMRQGCTDATVLAARRIPLFGIFLQNSLPIVRKVLGDAEGRAWYAAMATHLDQAGQGDLASWLEASFAGETSTTG